MPAIYSILSNFQHQVKIVLQSFFYGFFCFSTWLQGHPRSSVNNDFTVSSLEPFDGWKGRVEEKKIIIIIGIWKIKYHFIPIKYLCMISDFLMETLQKRVLGNHMYAWLITRVFFLQESTCLTVFDCQTLYRFCFQERDGLIINIYKDGELCLTNFFCK